MAPRKSSFFGYLRVDHRASPGLPEDVARAAGYDPALCREGRVFEADTLSCCHCGSHQVKNPERTRERGWCARCDRYVCDPCHAAMAAPGYVHRTIDGISDLLVSGKWTLRGSMSFPLIVPREG